MDSSGNNRYELLFMDEDSGAAPAPIQKETKKKPANPATAVPAKKTQTAAAAKKSIPEKENKAGTLNKSDGDRKPAGASTNRVKQDGSRPTPGGNRNRQGDNADESGARSARPNNEVREQRNNRRNFREGGFNNASGGTGGGTGGGSGGEYGNERQTRPFNNNRDYNNRGPPRNRFGENNFRGGKREFDRQSGSDKTGVKAVDKRDGNGAHNWGSVKQEIEDVNKATTDTEAALTEKDDVPNEQNAEPTPTVPEEEETKEMTLDEWKALREQRAKPQYNTRKAGEGEDTTQWKKMVVLNKKKEGGDSEEEEFEYDPSLYPQRVGRLQRIVDIQFNFNDGRRNGGGGGGGFRRDRGPRGPRPGGNDNGGRGRFEGGRGRFDGGRTDVGRDGGGVAATGEDEAVPQPTAARPNRNYAGVERQRNGPHALKVDDERQFPTLS